MGAASSSDASQDPAMSQFFEEVKEIKELMGQIRRHLVQLQADHEESKSVTQAAAMKVLKQQMESNVDEVSIMAKNIKEKLEALDKANLQNRKKPGAGEGTSIDRIRMSMTTTQKKKLKELMDEFQTLRQKIQTEYREVVERRVFTVTGKKLDEETIDRLIETGHSEQIFHKAIQEQGRGQILDTLDEIQQRHDAVKDIERKLLDLHQIFLDMAVLVDEQGELLDNIETQVSKAVDHVQEGTKVLHRAKSLQKNSRKWMCIAIIILLIIIVIIVVGVVQPWKTKSA
ncbi:hypothetical protein KP509_38G033900 [Ceratopteris richardii]|nr:hypothetical protein KP509_38G033900 [Ceratopteris richardii]